ncbi:MAG: hypothetical protein EA368_11035 [Leptolyngbya sp. DLM2.Bin27]|nr:MAG: hypothetical protein EA368_11035 [Leptolyngbya sp. DLM2.Bin27]
MATVRLIVVLLVLGIVVLLGAQNLATTIPLVFFGGSTQALPLGVWLVSAIALGAITTLGLTALLRTGGSGARNRSAAYKYRPQSFYEPTAPGAGSRAATSEGRGQPPPRPTPGTSRRGAPASASGPGDDDPTWRAWTNFQAPGQWNDWESLSQPSNPETTPATSTASGIIDGVTTWFSSSKQRAKQQQKINESLQELDGDWGDMQNRPYRAPGVSPVQDSLDDITQGWEASAPARDSNPDPRRDPKRDFEASQAPRRVYRDGSIYSYSYRDQPEPAPSDGQVDNIYAPPDDAIYGDDGDPYDAAAEAGYASGQAPDQAAYQNARADDYDDNYDLEADNDTRLGEPEIAEDGVVDADYRVIVPPYTAAAEAAAETWVDVSPGNANDDWDDADDALTP